MKKTIKGITYEITFHKIWTMLEERKISVQEFTELAKLTPREISLLKKDGNITLSTLSKVREALNCKIEDILDEKEYR